MNFNRIVRKNDWAKCGIVHSIFLTDVFIPKALLLILHATFCLSVNGRSTGNWSRNNHIAWRQKLLLFVSCYTFTATQLVPNTSLKKTHFVNFFLIAVPCILISIKFIHQQIALFINLDKVLKFTLKITLTCSYMFRSTTIIREHSLEPS